MQQDTQFLMLMYQIAQQILDDTQGYSQAEFAANVRLQASTAVKLLSLSKCSKALTVEAYQSLPSIAGTSISSLRDAVVDADDNVDPDLLWQVVQGEIEPLMAMLSNRLPVCAPSQK